MADNTLLLSYTTLKTIWALFYAVIVYVEFATLDKKYGLIKKQEYHKDKIQHNTGERLVYDLFS